MDGIAISAMAITKPKTTDMRFIFLPPEREKSETGICDVGKVNTQLFKQTQWETGIITKYSGEKRGQQKTRDPSLRSG